MSVILPPPTKNGLVICESCDNNLFTDTNDDTG